MRRSFIIQKTNRVAHMQPVHIHLDSIDSTNNWVRNHIKELDPQKLTLVTAGEQTAGKGRGSRRWISPPGENIYATFFFGIPNNTIFLVELTHLLINAAKQTLQERGFDAVMKWPNDLLLYKKKICGVLAETIHLDEGKMGIIIGIGLNINMPAERLAEIDQPATSLFAESGTLWSVQELTAALQHHFAAELAKLK